MPTPSPTPVADKIDRLLALPTDQILGLVLLGLVLIGILVARWWIRRRAGDDGPVERRENCQLHISAVSELSRMVDHLHERINVNEGRAAMTETSLQMLQRAVTLNSESLQKMQISSSEISSSLSGINEKQDVALGGLAAVMSVLPESKKKFADYENGRKKKTATEWVRELLAPAEASPGAEEV